MTWFAGLLWAALAVALAFLVLPVVAIFVDVGPGELLASLDDPGATDALLLSLQTSLTAIVSIVVIGTPAAWLLAAVGPRGLLAPAGVSFTLSTAAVVVALTFVAAPFYLRQAQAAFAALDRSWLDASRTLGAGEARTLARVAIPAALPGLTAGLALAWGRAIGEFGATLMFAGSFRGVTQTVPLAIYERFATDFTGALGLSAVLVCVSAAILLTVKLAFRAAS